jgi:type I site-specific restriction endonuclease
MLTAVWRPNGLAATFVLYASAGDAVPLSEADTRAKLIDPALHGRGWTEDLIRREETAGTVDIIDGKPRRRGKGRTDYTLRVKVNSDTQPVAVAVLEAKAEHLPPAAGLEQAKWYGLACKRLNTPFVIATNGRADSDRSWTVTRDRIEARNYDLKAVNPNANVNEDKRTPGELLDIIEAKQREIAALVAALRK